MELAPRGLTGHDVAADDLAPQRGQRLGHHRDDAAAGGLDVGGAAAGGGYSGAEAGAHGGSGVGGLGGCKNTGLLLITMPGYL